MKLQEIESSTEFQNWCDALQKLDDYIDSLAEWNGHAEDCQREYDQLLARDPRLQATDQ